MVVRRFVGTVPDILGLVWPRFRPKSDPKSKIPDRILKSVRGPFSSAESSATPAARRGPEGAENRQKNRGRIYDVILPEVCPDMRASENCGEVRRGLREERPANTGKPGLG